MSVEITDRAIELAQQRRGLDLLALTLEARRDVFDFLAQSGGRSSLSMSAG